jgi:peptidoglycan/LPS O-acetylase OafA/YrhL
MFGTFRTILAALVVLQHFSPARLVGSMAVFAFFTLSGFLMTMLMDTTYRGRPEAFALNRFLRLYPH